MIYNPLPPIWTAYKTIQDCLKMSQKAIKGTHFIALLNKTDFMNKQSTESYKIIEESKTELDDLFVVALWATYERFMRDYLQVKGQKLEEVSPNSLANLMYEHFYTEVEYWKPYDMLEMLKDTVSPALLGHAKQIVKYRDWVA